MNDPAATVIFKTNGYKTVLFPENKGPKTNTWEQTKHMAFELNKADYDVYDVAFIPEIDDETCADSLIMTGKIYRLADIKYCVTTNSNTLAKELEHGFKQAGTTVLQLEHMDAGLFKEAIDYLLRNEIPHGNIILMNKYGKTVELLKKDLKTGVYKKAIKGLL
jgi:hypothetical protein